MTLLEKLANPSFLEKAWQSLNKYNTESHGLSGETIRDYKNNLEYRFSIISESLLNGTYTFKDTRAFLIPKDNGGYRPLQIPEVGDRVVLKGIAILLEDELKDILKEGEGVSFAYQKGLGVKDAIESMKRLYDAGYEIILEADIKQFFPTVCKSDLLKQVFSQLSDSTLNKYIQAGINQKVGGLQKVERPEFFQNANSGIPQGNPLSPLFSNFFLAPFDRQMKAAGFALIRYADDFIVMCKTEDEAIAAYNKSIDVLERELHLELHPLGVDSKTKIVDPVKESFSFLSIAFDGHLLFPSTKSKDRFIKNIERICYEERKTKNILSILTSLKNSLDGWISTYSFTNVERYFKQIDTEINKHLYVFLSNNNWKLSRKSLGKVPGKFRRNNGGQLDSGSCLSMKQRESSGIPICQSILSERRHKSTS